MACAGLVGLGQIGHRELAQRLVARIGVAGQCLHAVPGRLAERRLDAELVLQADLGDAMDVAQRFVELEVRQVAQPAGEGLDDGLLAQAVAARTPHGQDEGETEAAVVVGVELLDAVELLGRAGREPGLALFVRGFGGQRAGHHGLSGQFRVGADERQLRLARGLGHRSRQRMLELRQAAERPLAQRGLGDPGRVFVEAVEPGCGVLGWQAVEQIQCERGHGRIQGR